MGETGDLLMWCLYNESPMHIKQRGSEDFPHMLANYLIWLNLNVSGSQYY